MSDGICPKCGHPASSHKDGCNYMLCECEFDEKDIIPHPYPGVIEYSIYQKYAKLQNEYTILASENATLRAWQLPGMKLIHILVIGTNHF